MATLSFKMTALLPIIEHAAMAPKHKGAYGQKPEPALWLVKDEGIYLMSNGDPGLINEMRGAHTKHVVAYANGFDPRSDEDVWERSVEAVGGDDFVEQLPLSFFLKAQADGADRVSITISEQRIRISASGPKPARRLH